MKKMTAVSALVALFTTSCASYKSQPLQQPMYHEVDISKPSSEKVHIYAKKMTRAECIKYFDRDIINKGYYPVQLFIQNESANSYIFSLSRLSLPTARAEEVADKVHTSTVGRAVGYGVGSLFVWPLIIPAFVDGFKSSNANTALDQDFDNKVARDQLINEYSYFNKVLFIPKNDFKQSFEITLVETGSHKPITYCVSVW